MSQPAIPFSDFLDLQPGYMGHLSNADIRAGRFVPHDLVIPLIEALKRFRRCTLLGAARSGKTSIACLLGFNTHVAETTFQHAFYVDCAKDFSENDIQFIPRYGRDALYVFDNWQARPELWDGFRLYIDSDLTDAHILYVATHFGGSDDHDLLNTLPMPVFRTTPYVQKVARGMIELRVQEVVKGVPSFFDEEDYDQALVFARAKKKLPGNLRVLSWRLRAWDPSQRHLRDVGEDELFRFINRQVLLAHQAHHSTLDRITSVTQWGLTYQRRLGEDMAGIGELEKANLVTRVDTGWRMDPTDAYLFLRAINSERDWQETATGLLKSYLSATPNQTTDVMISVISQMPPATRPSILLDLLSEEQNAARIAGKMAQQGGIHGVYLVFGAFARDSEKSQSMALAFLDGYGRDNFLTVFKNPSRSASNQRTLVRHIRRFDPDFADALALQRKYLPWDLDNINTLDRRLSDVTARWNWSNRSAAINTLREVDEIYLERQLKTNQGGAIHYLQNLLMSALWLDPDEASRLACLTPILFQGLDRPVSDMRKLSYLLRNCRVANPQAADDLLEVLLQKEVHTLVQPTTSGAFEEVGDFLVQVEKIRPGGVSQLSQQDTQLIEAIIKGGGSTWNGLIKVMSVLAILARATGEAIADKVNGLDKTPSQPSPSHLRWRRFGVLSLLGRSPTEENLPSPGIVSEEELAHFASLPAVHLILGLWGVQIGLGTPAATALLDRISHQRKVTTWLPQLLAYYPLPWNPETIVNMARTVFLAQTSPQESMIDHVLLASFLLSDIRWPRFLWFDANRPGHRALATALCEGVLRLEVDDTSVQGPMNIVKAIKGHPLVDSRYQLIENLMAPLVKPPLTIADWDARTDPSHSWRERAYWRGKLIQTGVVGWALNSQSQKASIHFFRTPSPSSESIYQHFGLQAPQPSPSPKT